MKKKKDIHEYQIEDYRPAFEDAGQGHVFRFLDELSDSEKSRLAKDLSKVDLETLNSLQSELEAKPTPQSKPEPAPMLELQASDFPWTPHESLINAEERGKQLLRDGKVAVVIVAGGQGTRLGFDEPKGLFPLWPHTRRLLFDGFAEQIRAIGDNYGVAPKLYLMTSSATDNSTVAAFMSADFFGLDHDRVVFFKQGKLPSLTKDGKLILSQKNRIAFNPDGHGGIFEALKRRGCLEEMRKDGIEWVFYCQVDNPFARIAEPAFIGALAEAKAELGIKAVRKLEPSEKVGVIGLRDGAPTVVEYSELSEEDAQARAEDGSLLWKAGNTAIHAFSFDFIERVCAGDALPLHQANKAVPFISEEGEMISPDKPNACKFERFIFDSFSQASGLLNVECARELEFIPVKSSEGPTSPSAVREAMQAAFRKALGGLGVNVSDSQPLEISSALWADHTRLKACVEAYPELFTETESGKALLIEYPIPSER